MKYFRISIPGYEKPQKLKHLKKGTLILITGFDEDYVRITLDSLNKKPTIGSSYIVVEYMGLNHHYKFVSVSNGSGVMISRSGGYLRSLSHKITMKIIDPIDLILYTDNKTDRYISILKGEP